MLLYYIMSKEYVDPATYEFSNLYYKTITDDMQKNIQLDKEAKAIAEENERGYQARKRAEEMTEEVAETPVKPTSTYNNKRKVDSRAFDAPFGYGHTSIKRAEKVQERKKYAAHRFGGFSKKRASSKRKSNKNKKRTIRRKRR